LYILKKQNTEIIKVSINCFTYAHACGMTYLASNWLQHMKWSTVFHLCCPPEQDTQCGTSYIIPIPQENSKGSKLHYRSSKNWATQLAQKTSLWFTHVGCFPSYENFKFVFFHLWSDKSSPALQDKYCDLL
jgi:hypothetical protein